MAWRKEEGDAPNAEDTSEGVSHDALFKRIFSKPEHAQSLMEAHLPPELVARLDFSSLTLKPGSYVDEELRAFHTDLLFTVNMGPEKAVVAVLVEHQSAPHRMMAFRVLEYTVRVWSAWRKEHGDSVPLPPVIPLVIYHGDERWWPKQEVFDLVQLPPDLAEPLRPYLPKQRYLLQDLSQLDRAAIEALPASDLVGLALFVLQFGRSETLIEGLQSMPDRLAGSAAADRDALLDLIRYSMHRNAAPPAAFVKELAPALAPQAQEVVVTAAHQLREEGREEGELKGMARVLANQIELRFGLVDGVKQRLAAASAETLDRWSKAILTAKTLDELFDDDE